MSRSFKKHAMFTLSKAWDKFKEKSFRNRVKKVLHNLEIDFDPDRDWEEANLTNKGLGEYGTRFGWKVPPNPDDSWYNYYNESLRK